MSRWDFSYQKQKNKKACEVYIKKIDDMLNSFDYGYAFDFLSDVRDFAINNGYLTEKQKSAIDKLTPQDGAYDRTFW